jgi:hypothetical protein
MLATSDAPELYEQHGFSGVARPERLMEIVDMDIYQRGGALPDRPVQQ